MLKERYISNDLIIDEYPITPNSNWFNVERFLMISMYHLAAMHLIVHL